jgi:hypothetical protein
VLQLRIPSFQPNPQSEPTISASRGLLTREQATILKRVSAEVRSLLRGDDSLGSLVEGLGEEAGHAADRF